MLATSVARERTPAPVWRQRLLAGVCALALAALLTPSAQAQFVCDSTTPGGADGATATGTSSVACGTNANAVGGSTAVGDSAGAGANAGNIFNTAVGANAGRDVTGSQNTASGVSSGRGVTGDSNTASGPSSGRNVTGSNNIATGVLSGFNVTGSDNTASGRGSGRDVTGSQNIAVGFQAGRGITANDTIAIGTNSLANSDGAIAMGLDSQATGTNAIAIGQGAVATGSIAAGTAALASNGGAAFGDFSTASGTNSTAVGPNTTATHANSAAFGNGATTTRANQQVFGTASNSYTMPGVTSSHSKSVQGSPTHIVTSNAGGDLAAYTPSDLGLATTGDVAAINDELAKVSDEKNAGIALAMSMENPDLTGNERFGMAANWGAYEDANALGLSLMGVLGNNFVTEGDRVAISGGFGIGFDNGGGDDVYGGRVGLQWTR